MNDRDECMEMMVIQPKKSLFPYTRYDHSVWVVRGHGRDDPIYWLGAGA
jgi:hypothetical protein